MNKEVKYQLEMLEQLQETERLRKQLSIRQHNPRYLLTLARSDDTNYQDYGDSLPSREQSYARIYGLS